MSEKKDQNIFKNINTFMEVEIASLKKEFKEKLSIEIGVTKIIEKDGNYHFVANKKSGSKITSGCLAEGISKDIFYAKAKMVVKLREVLKAMKCGIKNPIHRRRHAFIY